MSEEEIRTLDQHLMFDLYVDPIVDNIHPNTKNILGFVPIDEPLLSPSWLFVGAPANAFVPIDEPLLSLVFDGKRYTVLNAFGGKFMLPEPEVLLATKLNSVPNRDKEHKRIKDIADIYALLWYSDIKIKELKERLLSVYAREKTTETVSSFTDDELSVVSQVLDIDKAEIKRVFAELL